ncbi:Outer membrane protein beta-barrel domain [Myroides sp. A21]|uniref:outer membrane beta-barrel protein n=1 Tax=Myroides sp. A21 TaxID=1583100 RepID=UPI00057FF6D6|nr:outer membrane beta-barrel protein [Myroides sp. A21]AJA70605.1 Outer membrane protein beta-barrel domain [Myroides sp. A21]
MNDKWLNDLEQKMKDHTEIGPEGLWEDLEQKLFGEEKGKIIPLWSDTVQQATNKKGAPKRIDLKRVIGIVASIAIVLVGGVELYLRSERALQHDDKEKDSIVIDAKETEVTPNSRQNQYLDKVEEEVITKDTHINTKALASNEKEKPSSQTIEAIEERREPSIVEVVDNSSQESQKVDMATGLINQNNVQEQLATLVEESHKNLETAIVEHQVKETEIGDQRKSKKNRGFSLGLISSNIASTSSMQQSGYNTMSGAMKVGADAPLDLGMAGAVLSEIYVVNQNKEVYTDITHKKPIRFGIALYYPMGDKWGINTGITYTKLSSDLTSGSQEYKIINTQTLHYVGVPIQVNYNLWEKGNFSAYVNGGFHIEKSVYGTLKTKFQADQNVEKRPDEKVTVKGIQTSANVAIGMEYKLAKSVGLFVEPGARYYFDNGSSIKTIYTEKPFDFNLQLGLRYSIPNTKKSIESKE